MKKIYLLLVGLIAFACINTANAQTVLFSEDFSGGAIPATWTSVGTPAWAYTTVGGNFGGQLLSTTAADGYAIFDSDGFGAGAQNADLITPSIVTTGQTNVNLQFQQLFRQYGTSIATVSVRSNNGPWNDVYTIGALLANGDITANPDLIDIDISAFAANSANVQLKFNFVGNYDYWWMFDDLFVYAPAAFDASLNSAFISEYTAVPLTQITPLTPSCEVGNNGGSALTGVSVATTITATSTNTVVYSSTLTQASLAVGAVTTLTAATSYTPTVADFYLVEFIVSVNEADAQPLNDTIVTAINITDSLYARDFFLLTGNVASLGGPWFLGAGNDGQIGNVFTAEATTDLVSATATFAGSFAIGDQAQANLYSMVAGEPGALIASSTVLTVAQADTPVIFYDFVFPPSTTLTAGTDYFISVQQNAASSANFAIYTSNNIYTPNTSFLQVNGGAWEELGASGIGEATVMLRANIYTPPCSITDVTAGNQTACNNQTNEYTQEITVSYANNPTTGMLNVNGQTFAITSSPQTVTLTGLDSDGASNNVTAFFTDDVACTYTESAVFTAAAFCLCPTINVTVNTTDVTNCGSPNGTAAVTVMGGAAIGTYTWDQGVVAGQTATGLSSGTYTVIVTDVDGCSGTGSGTVSNTLGVNAAIDSTSNISCNGGSDGVIGLVLTSPGTAPITYTWSHEGFTSTSAIRNDLDVADGPYEIRVTDAGGCFVDLGPVTLSEPTAVSVVTSNAMDITCNNLNDGSFLVAASGGTAPYMYNVNNGTPQMSGSFTNLAGGSYQASATDANGCTPAVAVAPVVINNPAVLGLTTSNAMDVSCFDAEDGSFTATATGGTTPYMYSVNGGTPQMSGNFSNLEGDTYVASVTDVNGCPNATAVPFAITEPAEIEVEVTASSNVSCNNANDGAIDITVTGGQGTLIYNWGPGNPATEDLDSLAASATPFVLSVTDINGCNGTSDPVTITEPDALTGSVSTTPESTSGAADGTATVTPAGGTAPFTYLWSDGQTSQTATGLVADSYTCTVTDANACEYITMSADVDLTNGIKDLDLTTFKVYPNPASKEVTVTFDINNAKAMTIKFYNTIGKVVLNDVASVNGLYKKTFSIGDLAAGIYIVEVSNEDGASIQKLTISK